MLPPACGEEQNTARRGIRRESWKTSRMFLMILFLPGEYLINEKYTSAKKLGILGYSNGGLLTGACLTQRPCLYGAVVAGVPVIDMLRYHHFTAGRYWTGEYGCADDPEHFQFLYRYSPLHNVKMNAVYPPVLIMTADTDDRVVPSHARKFAATLQAADSGENPILIRIEKSAGHGAGKPMNKIIEENADLFTFLYVNLFKTITESGEESI